MNSEGRGSNSTDMPDLTGPLQSLRGSSSD